MKTGRNILFVAMLILLGFAGTSCNLFGDLFDYRKDVCGEYSGYRVFTYYILDHYEMDTTFNVSVELSMGEDDSIVDLIYYWPDGDTTYESKTYSFIYDGITFQCITNYTSNSISLTVEDESLHFNDWPGMAPNTYDVFATKLD